MRRGSRYPIPCVVDHRVERPQALFTLFRDRTSLSSARQITDDYRLSPRNSRQRLLPSLLVAGMQDYVVPLLEEGVVQPFAPAHPQKPVMNTRDISFLIL